MREWVMKNRARNCLILHNLRVELMNGQNKLGWTRQGDVELMRGKKSLFEFNNYVSGQP